MRPQAGLRLYAAAVDRAFSTWRIPMTSPVWKTTPLVKLRGILACLDAPMRRGQ
jgi:hypothetical protein